MGDVTILLERAHKGDDEARNELFASGAVVLIAVIIVVIMLSKRDK